MIDRIYALLILLLVLGAPVGVAGAGMAAAVRGLIALPLPTC